MQGKKIIRWAEGGGEGEEDKVIRCRTKVLGGVLQRERDCEINYSVSFSSKIVLSVNATSTFLQHHIKRIIKLKK